MTQPQRSHCGWSGETGHLNAAMLERHLSNLRNPIYYVAGSASMVEGIRGALYAAGIEDDEIRSEEFGGY